jgi:hypothetical protein
VGMAQDQMGPSGMRVVAIPVRPCEVCPALAPLSAGGTLPLLLVQDLGTNCRGGPQGWLSIMVWKVRLPLRIARGGVALAREVALRFDRLLHPAALFAARWVGAPPGFTRLLGQIACRNPPASFIRVAGLGPSLQPSPHKTVQCGACLSTDDVPMGVCPPP